MGAAAQGRASRTKHPSMLLRVLGCGIRGKLGGGGIEGGMRGGEAAAKARWLTSRRHTSLTATSSESESRMRVPPMSNLTVRQRRRLLWAADSLRVKRRLARPLTNGQKLEVTALERLTSADASSVSTDSLVLDTSMWSALGSMSALFMLVSRMVRERHRGNVRAGTHARSTMLTQASHWQRFTMKSTRRRPDWRATNKSHHGLI